MMDQRTSVFSLIVIYLAYSDALKCPGGYSTHGYLCYKFESGLKTWDDAAVYCQHHGQELVSWNKNESIGKFLQGQTHGQTVWIGLRELVEDQKYYWMDAKTVYTKSQGSGLWHPNEPSSGFGDYCAQIRHDNGNKLFAKNCGIPCSFICKACAEPPVNCTKSSCESGPDSRSLCSKCIFTYLPSPDKRRCEKACEYDNPCWPGNCEGNYLRNCNCTDGFREVNALGQNHCQLSSSTKPVIENCQIKVFADGGKRSDSKSNTTSNQCDFMQHFYGNFQPDYMSFELGTSFRVNTSTFPVYSDAYLTNTINFGITDVNVKLLKEGIDGNTIEVNRTFELSDHSNGQNVKDTFYSKKNMSVSSKLVNGERLCMVIGVKGGGYMVTKDTSKHTHVNHTYEYDKTHSNRTICYIMDTVKPVHKSQLNLSKSSPFDVSERITRTGTVNVSFVDWIDPLPTGGNAKLTSGISKYEVSVFDLKYSNGSQAIGSLMIPAYGINDTDNPVMELNLTFPSPRLVCLVLEVKDAADNIGFARRFVLSDSSSFITIDSSKSFNVSSASPATNYKWQTHHNDICLSWKGYFYNEVYINNHFLDPILPDPDTMGIYEQETGELPIRGTPNIYGITAFNFSWSRNTSDIYQQGPIPDFEHQNYCQSISLSDGETYTLNITAIDIVQNIYTESRILSIDGSVPHINNIWLINDGYESLFAHGDKDGDLTEITIDFDVLDPHSGIWEIQWAFGTTDGGTELISKSISVNETDNCEHIEHCICPSVGKCQITKYTVSLKGNILNIGNHNRNYYFTIKATNKARLSNIEHVEILVDTSPPETGVVFEGPEDTPDIDFSSSPDFMVHWHGFVDHESDIKAYRVVLADHCLNKTEMSNTTWLSIPTETVVQYKEGFFAENSARLSLNYTGKYYVTVTAANNAAQFSVPACSDGITRDQTGPSIGNVSLVNGRWRETLHCENGKTWLLHSSLAKIRLHSVPACIGVCINTTHARPLPKLLPEKTMNTTDEMIAEFACMEKVIYSDDIFIYLPNDHIEITWDIDEHGSQIDDIFVGIGSHSSEYVSPDIMAYQSTNKRTLYRQNHAGLNTDDPIYIFIKARNKANLETVATFGPIIIDETAPVQMLPIDVAINNGRVVVGWENATFVDPEQEDPISSIFFQIEGDGEPITPLLEWNWYEFSKCFNFSGGCITYPIKRLQSKDTVTGRAYAVVLFVYNNAGHMLRSSTHTFKLPSKYPPGHGMVIDINPSNTESITDISAHTTPRALCVAWSGFEHHENISLEIAVGTLSNKGNIQTYQPVPNNGFTCLYSTRFITNVRFFITIRASCTGGMTVSSSNGVTIINETEVRESLIVSSGLDCKSSDLQHIEIDNLSISSNDSFYLTYRFHVGYEYYLQIYGNGIVSAINFEVADAIAEVIDILWYRMIPYKNQPLFRFTNNYRNASDYAVHIKACRNGSYIDENSMLHSHWRFGKYSHIPFTFQVALGKDCSSNTSTLQCAEQLTPFRQSNVNNSASLKVDSIDNRALYTMLVQPCIADGKCFQYVASSEVKPVGQLLEMEIVRAKIEVSDCISVDVQWTVASHIEEVMFFRWTISKNPNATHMLTDWDTVLAGQGMTYNISRCITMPALKHETLYICVTAYTWSSMSFMQCTRLHTDSDTNEIRQSVYEFDSSLKSFENVKQLFGSQYLGNRLSELLDAELDFGNSSSIVTAAMTSASERNITWYLMTSKYVPMTCSTSSECITSLNTTFAEHVVFKQSVVPKDTILFSCAISEQASIHREGHTEQLGEIRSCSDGFVIDTQKPTSGKIVVANHDGYIADIRHTIVYWYGFTDAVDSDILGYIDPIKHYTISAGFKSGSDDIYSKTNIGLEHTYLFNQMNVTDGTGLFITVTATDQAGLETSVTTDYLIVDSSPPSRGDVVVEGNQFSVISSDSIYIDLSGFEDPHSGIHHFEVGIGSRVHSSDLVPMQNYFTNHILIQLNLFQLDDGKQYYIVVQAMNRAGLKTEPVSKLFTVDRSPPTGGHVLDGLRNNTEVDYQENDMYIAGYWYGFNDPHSSIMYYRVGLGSRPYFDDEESMIDVGLQTNVIWRKSFTTGTKYYITVEACNKANLCTVQSSDGLILDRSGPTPGRVQVGHTERHGKYQSEKTSLNIRWFGFSDQESGIDHFEVCLGTGPRFCDVQPFFSCLLASSITKTGLDIPVNIDIYARVKAFNKIGMYVVKESGAFRIDLSPPVMLQAPSIVLQFNNIRNSYMQYDPSVLRVQWRFKDTESPIIKHYVTLKTHHEGHLPINNIELGSTDRLTFSFDKTDWLRDGDSYYVIVTSCNAAGLCTSAESHSILVDSSPPHQGGFTSNLKWKNFQNGTSEISLYWHSFEDAESGVDEFYITVSRNYSGSELSNGVLTAQYDDSTRIQNGTFQLMEILTRDEQIVLTIWAKNRAGLNSSVSRISVNVLMANTDLRHALGVLEIEKHSCRPQYCSGDCTCAVVGKPCERPSCSSNGSLNQARNNQRIRIFWGLPNMVQTITTSSACLAAHWNSTDVIGAASANFTRKNILRYEYSIGRQGEDYGAGVFSKDRIPWIDVGLRQEVVYCLKGDMQLEHGESYMFYVRTWMTRDVFQTYNSGPIRIDHTPPSIKRGSRIQDSDASCQVDHDIIDWMDTMTACWNNVFIEQQGKLIHYTVALGTTEKADDMMSSTNVGLQTSITVTNMSLYHGTKYFFTVTAYNDVGLHTTLSSDGFLIDMDRPRKGHVFNTGQYKNSLSQSDSSTFSISWTGFTDDQSGILSYFVALLDEIDINIIDMDAGSSTTHMYLNTSSIGIEPTNRQSFINNVTFHKASLKTKYTFDDLALEPGMKYYGVVKAIDAGGHESGIAVSQGRLVDITGPVGFKCVSFEQVGASELVVVNKLQQTVFQANFTQKNLYKINGFLNKSKSEVGVYFEMGEHRLRLQTVLNHDGEVQFEYSFLSRYDGIRNISLSIEGESKVFVNAALWRCKSTKEVKDGVVDVRQIGPTLLAVNVLVQDKGSSIYKVLIGAGSIQGGFQLRALQQISDENNGILEVNVQHATPILVTAIAENQAGLKSTFYSNKMLFDLTPPNLAITNSSIRVLNGSNEEPNNSEEVTVVADITWSVSDMESGLKRCYCSFGFLPGSEDLVNYSPAETSTWCSSKPLHLPHSTALYGNVRCVNNVELKSESTTVALKLIKNQPSAYDAKVNFIPLGYVKHPANELNGSFECLSIQPVLDRLSFQWAGFYDVFGIERFEYRIMHAHMSILDWTETKKTSVTVTFHNRPLMAGKTYTAEVYAVNGANLRSGSITCAVLVDDRKPELTGHGLQVSRDGLDLRIDWQSVFVTNPMFSCRFNVYIGTRQGSADIADISYTKDFKAEVVLPGSGLSNDGAAIRELYVGVECTYPTGAFRLVYFNQHIDL